jgi:hypothetical protein
MIDAKWTIENVENRKSMNGMRSKAKRFHLTAAEARHKTRKLLILAIISVISTIFWGRDGGGAHLSFCTTNPSPCPLSAARSGERFPRKHSRIEPMNPCLRSISLSSTYLWRRGLGRGGSFFDRGFMERVAEGRERGFHSLPARESFAVAQGRVARTARILAITPPQRGETIPQDAAATSSETGGTKSNQVPPSQA